MKYAIAGLLTTALCITLGGCLKDNRQGNRKGDGGRETVSVAQSATHSSPQSLFRERAVEAGLIFKHDAGSTGDFYFVENTAPGCAFFDFDNDGFLDVFLVQSGAVVPIEDYVRPHCTLFRNNRNGTFTNVTANSGLDKDLGYAQGVAAADYDNDGRTDLFVTAYGGNRLLRNQGNGKFSDVTASQGLDKERGYATSAAWGDYDNDSRLDLYVCYYVQWTPQTNKPCRNNQTNELDYCSPLLYEPVTSQLYRNTGKGFINVSASSGIAKKTGRSLAVAFVDYNIDGKQDVFVANDLSPNLLWHNNGNGTFREAAVEAGVALGDQGRAMAGMGIAIADFDRSGRDSLYVTNFSERPNMLFRNVGEGVFEDATEKIVPPDSHDKILSFGCEFVDYNADGWPDIITNNGHVQMLPAQRSAGLDYKQPKQLLRNNGRGQLHLIEDAALLGDLVKPALGRGLAIGDYDNDGHVDILASNQNESPQLFHNEARNGNHWVSLHLIGTKSNRDAAGARITLRAGKIRQSVSVRGGSSYLSSSDRRVYFGLGSAKEIDEVIINWPSGTRETLKNLAGDTFYTLTVGKAISAERRSTGIYDKSQ